MAETQMRIMTLAHWLKLGNRHSDAQHDMAYWLNLREQTSRSGRIRQDCLEDR